MAITMKVRRLDELFKVLRKVAPAAAAAELRTEKRIADEMVRLARSFVAVKTGRLQRSIVATGPGQPPPAYSQGGAKLGGGVVPAGAYMVTAGDARVRYAHIVEHGSKPHLNKGEFPGTLNPGAPAQPFFMPAWRLVKKDAAREIGKAVRAEIQTIIK